MIYVLLIVIAVTVFFAGYFAGRTSAFKECTKVIETLHTRQKEIEDTLETYGVLPKKGTKT